MRPHEAQWRSKGLILRRGSFNSCARMRHNTVSLKRNNNIFMSLFTRNIKIFCEYCSYFISKIRKLSSILNREYHIHAKNNKTKIYQQIINPYFQITNCEIYVHGRFRSIYTTRLTDSAHFNDMLNCENTIPIYIVSRCSLRSIVRYYHDN